MTDPIGDSFIPNVTSRKSQIGDFQLFQCIIKQEIRWCGVTMQDVDLNAFLCNDFINVLLTLSLCRNASSHATCTIQESACEMLYSYSILTFDDCA